MRGSRFLRVASLAAALACSAPTIAYAGDTVVAERRFSDGLADMKAERWEAACLAFAESNEADPSPGTQINLGVCNEKQKKYATALTWFDAAARLADEQGRQDRAKFARSEYARVAPKLHKLTLSMAQELPDATVTMNGTKSSAKLFIGRETPIDPGKYTIEVSAKGKRPVSKEITIPETPGTSALAFPALEDAPPEPVGTGEGSSGAKAGTGPVVVTNDGSGQRTVGIVVAGAGVLALLAAGGLQILANGQDDKSDEWAGRAQEAKDKGDDANARSFHDSSVDYHENAKLDQLLAIVTGAGGVVLVGVGAVLYFTAPRAEKSKARVLPSVGPGYAGASFGLSF